MNSPPPTSGRIFLSYARSDDPPDQPFVRRLHADLTAAGFQVWFDRESLMSRGLTFHQEIKDAIRTEVDRVVYVGGPKAAQSAYVREKWQSGQDIVKPANSGLFTAASTPVLRFSPRLGSAGFGSGYRWLCRSAEDDRL